MPPQDLRDHAAMAAGEALPDANCAAVRRRATAAKKHGSVGSEKTGTKSYTAEEVSKHSAKDDCWLMIKGKVYDVTGWGADHPGGEVLYTYGGQDATDVFSAFHGQSTWLMLRDRLIGTCVDAEEEGLVKDFRELRARMQQERMFECNPLFYAWKVASTFAILVVSLLLIAHSKTYLSVCVAGCLLGLFWQQCGWLAHDFLHHQVFKNRTLNDATGLIVGNLWQGFSVAWWKSKHNVHHAVPNKLGETHSAMDPDIDTLPLLAWSGDMIPALERTGSRFFVRHQHILFMPILLIARISWAAQSAMFSFRAKNKGKVVYTGWERACLALHYAWVFGAAFGLLSPAKAVTYFAVAQLSSGFFLSFVFIMSHNGMEVYNDGRNFIMMQMAATRNIDRSIFNDWFTGGLNQQIEHHLFPTLPRHNLHKAQKLMRELCSKHGVYYEECSLGLGFARVVARLREVAKLA